MYTGIDRVTMTFIDKDQWDAQFDWIISIMPNMKKAFKKLYN